MGSTSIFRTVVSVNVVVTIAAMALAYRALRRADDSERLVIRSHQILRATEETTRQLVDAESWERAYVATKAADDLAAFNRARRNVNVPDSLSAILQDEGHQLEAERLRVQIAATLAAFDQMVERTRAGMTVEGPTRTTARATIEAARATVNRISQTENDTLNARLRADATAGRWVNGLAVVMTGLATTLVTLLVTLLVLITRPGIWRGR